MAKYVTQTYEIFPEDLGGHIITPAAEHLREVNPDADKLDDGKTQTFYTLTARALFPQNRVRSVSL